MRDERRWNSPPSRQSSDMRMIHFGHAESLLQQDQGKRTLVRSPLLPAEPRKFEMKLVSPSRLYRDVREGYM